MIQEGTITKLAALREKREGVLVRAALNRLRSRSGPLFDVAWMLIMKDMDMASVNASMARRKDPLTEVLINVMASIAIDYVYGDYWVHHINHQLETWRQVDLGRRKQLEWQLPDWVELRADADAITRDGIRRSDDRKGRAA